MNWFARQLRNKEKKNVLFKENQIKELENKVNKTNQLIEENTHLLSIKDYLETTLQEVNNSYISLSEEIHSLEKELKGEKQLNQAEKSTSQQKIKHLKKELKNLQVILNKPKKDIETQTLIDYEEIIKDKDQEIRALKLDKEELLKKLNEKNELKEDMNEEKKEQKEKVINAQEWLDDNYPHEQRKVIKELNIRNKALTGSLALVGFSNLVWFNCSVNNLTNLDLSSCESLIELYCHTNNLTNLQFLNNLKADKLEALSIGDNNFSTSELTIFSSFINLKKLWIGSSEEAKIKQGYNQFTGSLAPLQFLTKLEWLEIENTNIDSGWEYLPESLEGIDCKGIQLTSLDVSNLPKLKDLYCDDYLYLEKKITGLEKTSIVRLDIRGGEIQKNQDPKFIWKTTVSKFHDAFPETKLMDISDLDELASQVNEKTANDKEFLVKICPTEIEKFFKKKQGKYYWILDQLSNSILARGLIIQNRLYEGKDEEYEKHLEELAMMELKCIAMNPKNPAASLYENREKLVNEALAGDKELLQRIADLPYISSWVKEQLAKEKE